jgi:ribonucleoside-diphosphate reductase alpha chain
LFFKRVASFDHDKLELLSRQLTRNLNQVIDRNFYPENVPQIKYSNLKHRPIAIGVQAQADVNALMDYSWESREAMQLNRDIYETIYFGSEAESVLMSKEEYLDKQKKLSDLALEIVRSENHIEELRKKLDVDNSLYKTVLIDGSGVNDLRSKFKEIESIQTYYESFPNSPASKGKLQIDLWREEKQARDPKDLFSKEYRSITTYRYSPAQYEKLRSDMKTYGKKNSLNTAIMPTASTAQTLGNNECMEPYTAMIYSRTVLSGQFVFIVRHMCEDYEEMDLWTPQLINQILMNNGSVQHLTVNVNDINYRTLCSIPYIKKKLDYDREGLLDEPALRKIYQERFDFLLKKYKNVYELSQKLLLQYSIDRNEFINQSESHNCFMEEPTFAKLTSYHFDGWASGLATGMYYLRTKAHSQAKKVSLKSNKMMKKNKDGNAGGVDCFGCT